MRTFTTLLVLSFFVLPSIARDAADTLYVSIELDVRWVDHQPTSARENGSYTVTVTGSVNAMPGGSAGVRMYEDAGLSAAWVYRNRKTLDQSSHCRVITERGSGTVPLELQTGQTPMSFQTYTGAAGAAAAAGAEIEIVMKQGGDPSRIMAELQRNLISGKATEHSGSYRVAMRVPGIPTEVDACGTISSGKTQDVEVHIYQKMTEQAEMKGNASWTSGRLRWSVSSELGTQEPGPDEKGQGGTITYSLNWFFGEETQVRIAFDGKDVTGQQQEVVIGQRIELEGKVRSNAGSLADPKWDLQGEHVERFEITSNSGQVDALEPAEKANMTTGFYWWEDGSHEVTFEIKVDGELVTAKTTFVVERPEIDLTVAETSGPPGIYTLSTGDGGGVATIMFHPQPEGSFEPTVSFKRGSIPKKWPGETQFVQLVKVTKAENKVQEGDKEHTYCWARNDADFGLDETYPYEKKKPDATGDSPGHEISDDYQVYAFSHMVFRMHLMYKPNLPEAIFVPHQMVKWVWEAEGAWQENDQSFQVLGVGKNIGPPEKAPEWPEWEYVSTANGRRVIKSYEECAPTEYDRYR